MDRFGSYIGLSLTFLIVKPYSILFILLAGFFYSFAQPGHTSGPSFKIVIRDSITGEKTNLGAYLDRPYSGKLLVEADPNDLRKEIFDKQLLIEVMHARGSSVLMMIPLTGLKAFEKNDVLKSLRPGLQSGDRIVLTFRMMSDSEPRAQIIKIK